MNFLNCDSPPFLNLYFHIYGMTHPKFFSQSLLECGGQFLAKGSTSAFSYDKSTSTCSIGNLVPETIVVGNGPLVYTLPRTKGKQ